MSVWRHFLHITYRLSQVLGTHGHIYTLHIVRSMPKEGQKTLLETRFLRNVPESFCIMGSQFSFHIARLDTLFYLIVYKFSRETPKWAKINPRENFLSIDSWYGP